MGTGRMAVLWVLGPVALASCVRAGVGVSGDGPEAGPGDSHLVDSSPVDHLGEGGHPVDLFRPDGCLPGVRTFTADGTFTLPSGCLQATIKAWGAGGGGGGAGGLDLGGAGGGGGYAEETLELAASEQLTIAIGIGGGGGDNCGGAGGGGGYAGGAGGKPWQDGVDGAGSAAGGAGGSAEPQNGKGGNGGYGGGGGGGSDDASAGPGGGGGGATVVRFSGAEVVVAGGGGGGGSGDMNDGGPGGPGCGLKGAGDPEFDAGGGGGGGACLGAILINGNHRNPGNAALAGDAGKGGHGASDSPANCTHTHGNDGKVIINY